MAKPVSPPRIARQQLQDVDVEEEPVTETRAERNWRSVRKWGLFFRRGAGGDKGVEKGGEGSGLLPEGA